MSNIYIRKSEIEETDEGNICLSAFVFENDAERKMKFEFPENILFHRLFFGTSI